MKVVIYRNTNFGNNEMVWNIPHPDYDFESHTHKTFDKVNIRFPLLTTQISLKGDYDINTTFFDYMIIENDDKSKVYYFINTILAQRGALLFAVTLDVITTHNMLEKLVSGTIIRKHDTNPNENKFDYPYALNFEGNYTDSFYNFVGYSNSKTRLIESAVNLSAVSPSVTIPSTGDQSIVIPQLPKPNHITEYTVTSWGSNLIKDDSRAYTLYLNDQVSESVLNTVRGLSGDGAISDSYVIPSDAVVISNSGAEVTSVKANFLTVTTDMKLAIDFSSAGWQPKNEATKGMFKVSISSIQETSTLTFPAWDLKESISGSGNLQVNLWCDPKPSGSPYCCPAQVFSLHPLMDSGILTIATLEIKSVKGGQWLRNPLVYSTGRGEIFSSIETSLERQRADYEKSVSLNQLEMDKKQRDIEIAQADYNYQSGLASSAIAGGAGLAKKDIGAIIGAAKTVYDANVNHDYIEQMRDLQAYQQETQKTLINMAYSNNLKNLNVQESIRRVVPREIVNRSTDSMGSYDQYNGFTISLLVPDMESLKSKDMEFSKYGYPCYESVTHFKMLDHLRECHTVYQFENPLIEIGGNVGNMIRTVLEGGIRILSKPYTSYNILNNPKKVTT